MNNPKKINLQVFASIYFFLFFISVVLNEANPYLKFPKLGSRFWVIMAIDVGIGCLAGLCVVLATWFLIKKLESFRKLSQSFSSLLGRLTVVEIFFIAAFSSMAEEFFFRGLVQAKVGIIVSSVLFGVLHTGPGKKYIPWTVFAVLMGFLLGGIYEWRQNLMTPIAAHFVINFMNLILMQRNDPPTPVAT